MDMNPLSITIYGHESINNYHLWRRTEEEENSYRRGQACRGGRQGEKNKARRQESGRREGGQEGREFECRKFRTGEEGDTPAIDSL